MELQVLSEIVNNHVVEVNKTLQELEDVDCRIKGVAGKTTVCLYTDYGTSGGTTKINDILPESLMAELETKVISAMERERHDRESRLLKMIQFNQTPDKIDTSALEKRTGVKEVEIKVNAEKKKPSGITASVEEVKALVAKGMSMTEITKELGVSLQTTYNFFDRHGIERLAKKVPAKTPASTPIPVKTPELVKTPTKAPVVELKVVEDMLVKKIPEIKALYTNGPFNMKMLSEEFKVDVKVMHDFCAKKGLLKVGKKDAFNGK